ncbi:hypothetical protein PHJA_002116400 [Phtheirospermum japonicum]|uniref:Uncharacterized protein n=1 Tax=Phtheirospermum japonicum TaxID=374723 RepID=A0A830CV70_9LAMI|nr:hypothetical protein PHJA_002116400 [Phtheirospermum japonicum]
MSNNQEDIYICPSFSSYSSNRLSEIAGRVAAVREDQEVSVEDFSCDGQIRHVFPVFNRDLLQDSGGEPSACGGRELLESAVPIPLSKLFIEEDRERVDYPPSCSSSEADELENVPEGTYCVWRPKLAESPMPSQCKKSKSTGSASRRWKLRDLMRRSKSDGKDSFVFLTPKHKEEKSGKSIEATNKADGKLGLRSASGGGGPAGSPSAHEAFYVRNKAMKEGEKKKSYLPYRRELVGFFANVNGLSSKSSVPQF